MSPRLGGNERVGVFASRSPNRPNGLGLSLVRLLAVESGVLRVAGIDAIDCTPVYDVKPYLPWCEAVPDARADWALAAPAPRPAGSVVVPGEIAAQLGAEIAELVRQVLSFDPRPAYQDEAGRVHGMTLAGWNVRWRTESDGRVQVVSAERIRGDAAPGSEGA